MYEARVEERNKTDRNAHIIIIYNNGFQDNETQEKVRQGLTKYGFTQKAINFLKLCVIMEPMQPIMQHCKTHPNVGFLEKGQKASPTFRSLQGKL